MENPRLTPTREPTLLPTLDAAPAIAAAWSAYEGPIQQCLAELATAPMPEEADFLLFAFGPGELRGLPIQVLPAQRDQQEHDDWPLRWQLTDCIPASVELPDLADTPERVDQLRDACADFMRRQWSTLDPLPARLAYFQIHGDGWYISMRDGRRISAWDIEGEITRLRG